MAVQIAAGADEQFVKTGDGAENPSRIDGIGEQFQFFRERSIAQDRCFQFGRKFKEIGEQAVENADLILEGGIAVLGQGRSVGEKLGETAALRGAFEDAQRALAAFGGGVDIHFDGEAGTTLGELRGEFDFGGLASGLFFQDGFHGRLRERGEMKLQAAGDDGGQKCIRRRRGQNQRGRAGGLLEDFQEYVGDIPAHGLRTIENEDAAAAHRLKVGGALHGTQLAHTQHGAGYRTLQTDRIGHEGPDIGMRLQD